MDSLVAVILWTKSPIESIRNSFEQSYCAADDLKEKQQDEFKQYLTKLYVINDPKQLPSSLALPPILNHLATDKMTGEKYQKLIHKAIDNEALILNDFRTAQYSSCSDPNGKDKMFQLATTKIQKAFGEAELYVQYTVSLLQSLPATLDRYVVVLVVKSDNHNNSNQYHALRLKTHLQSPLDAFLQYINVDITVP